MPFIPCIMQAKQLRAFLLLLFLASVLLCLYPRHSYAEGFGRISQSLIFEFHSASKNLYYLNGDITNEFADTEKNGEQEFTQYYSLRSRTLYHHKYFAVYFDYVNISSRNLFYNKIGVENKANRKKFESHIFAPQFYFTYAPLRVGIGYQYTLKPTAASLVQLLYLKPSQAFSTQLELYFAKLGKSPIGLSLFYEFAFNPSLSVAEIPNNFYSKAGFALHFYLNYYNQFKLVFYQAFLKKKIAFVKYNGKDDSGQDLFNSFEENNISRYYVDYVFIYKLADNFSMKISMGQLVYSNLESPSLHFSAGFHFHYGRIQ